MYATPMMQQVIVQFSHPGREYLPHVRKEDPNVVFDNQSRQSGTRLWNNCKDHKRKFMEGSGSYLGKLAGSVNPGAITFWGEWEAHSKFKKTPAYNNSSPQYIHVPYLDSQYDGPRRHNTDPFVFGDHFWYTNCKQKPPGKAGNFLTRLANNSIVLFGTEVKRGFLLDTVFVVGGSLDQLGARALIKKGISKQLLETNFMHKDLATDTANEYLRFYRALMYCENKTMFSFVPCRPFEVGTATFHERPLLEPWDTFSFQKPGTGAVCGKLFPDELRTGNGSLSRQTVKDYWLKIADACIQQKFALAIEISLPSVVGKAGGGNKTNESGGCSA